MLLRAPVNAQLSIAPQASDSGTEPWVAELRTVELTNLMFLSCVAAPASFTTSSSQLEVPLAKASIA